MEQRSEAWFEARRGRVTASNVGAILGHSPHRSRKDVMRGMVREYHGADREFQGNVATDWGTQNEAGAIIDYKLKTMHDVKAIGFVEREDWAGASPDGLVGKDGGIEIKCPFGIRTAHCPVPFKTLAEQPHYYDQVQFTLWVTQRQWWHFFQWTINETKLEIAKVDQDWVDSNIPRLRQFHAEFLSEIDNPEHLEPRHPVIDTPEAKSLIADWEKVNANIEALLERKRNLIDSLVSLAGDRNALIAGRKLTLVEREGAIAWARVAKDHCGDVDFEPYRGKASRFWRLS